MGVLFRPPPFPPVAVQTQRKENRAWGCCPEKVGVRSSCRGGRGGLTLDFCWSRDGFWTAVFEKCKYIPCGIFYNSFLPLSSTLFIYLSLCSLRNYLSHMSLIVLKPWALYPAQVFVFILFCFVSSLQLLCIAVNSLTLWPDSYPVMGRLTLPPLLFQEWGPGM